MELFQDLKSMNAFQIIKESVKLSAKYSLIEIVAIVVVFVLPLTANQVAYETHNLLRALVRMKLITADHLPKISQGFFTFGFSLTLLSSLHLSYQLHHSFSFYVSKPTSFIITFLNLPRITMNVFMTSLCAIFLKTANDVASGFIFDLFNHTDHGTPTIECVVLMIIDKEEFKDGLWWWFLAIIYYLIYSVVNGYLTALWHLASVISVMEPNVYGIPAMKMSIELLREKKGIALVLVLSYFTAISTIILLMCELLDMNYPMYLVIIRVFLILVCGIMLVGVNFTALLVQNVFYFFCKSHHNQIIDTNVFFLLVLNWLNTLRVRVIWILKVFRKYD